MECKIDPNALTVASLGMSKTYATLFMVQPPPFFIFSKTLSSLFYLDFWVHLLCSSRLLVQISYHYKLSSASFLVIYASRKAIVVTLLGFVMPLSLTYFESTPLSCSCVFISIDVTFMSISLYSSIPPLVESIE